MWALQSTRLRLTILVTAAISIISSCGIETYPYLYPPVIDGFPFEADTSVDFQNDGNNVPEYFEGYEFYYKLYSAAQAQAKDGSLADQEGETIEGTSGTTEVIALGYSRLFLYNLDENDDQLDEADNSTRPLIAPSQAINALIVPNEAINALDEPITIDFTDIRNSVYPVLTYLRDNDNPDTTEVIEVSDKFGRYVTPLGQEKIFKGFAPEDFVDGDSDLPEGLSLPSEPILYIALIVLSYGNDNTNLDFNLYSSPTYLGALRISTF